MDEELLTAFIFRSPILYRLQLQGESLKNKIIETVYFKRIKMNCLSDMDVGSSVTEPFASNAILSEMLFLPKIFQRVKSRHII
jgi:hypothetical protein